MFEPQPLATPLNDDALTSLRDLLPKLHQGTALQRDRHVPTKRHIQSMDALKQAANSLADVTGALNTRAYKRKTKHNKAKAHRQKERTQANPDDDDEDDEGAAATEAEADARYEDFERKSDDLTKKMDIAMRGIIDDLSWLAEYPDTLKAVIEKAQGASEDQRRTFEAGNQSPPRTNRKQQNADGEDEEDEEEDKAPTQQPPRPREPPTLDPSETPHIQLSAALVDQDRRWDSLSLTDRYARDNYYKGWKDSLWDAQNPGENQPPMPHETLWFAVEEGRSTTAPFRSTQRGNRAAPANDTSFTEPGEENDDSDIEISAETTSIKCPLTLLPFQTPMTSKNCNHSFEKAAILEILAECRTQPKKINCPATGCNVEINGEDDLYENQLLKRRVARFLAREAQKNAPATSDIEEDDDDDDDEDVIRGTQRKPVGVGSSPAAPSTGRRGTRNIKGEPRSSRRGGRDSVVPNSQLDGVGDGLQRGSQGSQSIASRPPRGTQILDLEDDD